MSKIKDADPILHSHLDELAELIETVENQCMAFDGPVPRTIDAMNRNERRKLDDLIGMIVIRHRDPTYTDPLPEPARKQKAKVKRARQ